MKRRSKTKLDWRKHLTPNEAEIVRLAEVAKVEWDRRKAIRAAIISAASQRARDAAQSKGITNA